MSFWGIPEGFGGVPGGFGRYSKRFWVIPEGFWVFQVGWGIPEGFRGISEGFLGVFQAVLGVVQEVLGAVGLTFSRVSMRCFSSRFSVRRRLGTKIGEEGMSLIMGCNQGGGAGRDGGGMWGFNGARVGLKG